VDDEDIERNTLACQRPGDEPLAIELVDGLFAPLQRERVRLAS
jgi:hypothetical protein